MTTTPSRARSSGIPTPGRLRSFSSSASAHPPPPTDTDAAGHAFADAIRANDPARHNPRSVSASSAAAQRPSSVASGSRPKTPTAALQRGGSRRPESRQSDAFVRPPGEYYVGENVRIESLGFEGTLRYVGEIAGKPGEWAGVELSGGFTGLGKNNGSVGGVQYFSCPEKCGVFVAYSKLSPPSVGPGAYSRPSSVASSRVSLPGRVTPSSHTTRPTSSVHSGRVTPAQSNGRITPSSSFGFSTPAARPAQRSTSRPTANTAPSAPNTPSASALSKITAGSRASKYVGMTAQQLSARKPTSISPPTAFPASPSKQSIGLGSPTRMLGPPSPSRSEVASSSGVGSALKPSAARLPSLGTPKSFGQGRPSLTNPKARIPSAIAMPPPPSPPGSSSRTVSLNDNPPTPTYSITSNDTATDDDGFESLTTIQQNSRALKDKIQSLMSGRPSSASANRAYSPLDAAASKGDLLRDDFGGIMSAKDESAPQVRALQERLDSLERENEKMKLDLKESQQQHALKADAFDALKAEREQEQARLIEVEQQLKKTERALNERTSKVESLERAAQASTDALESLRAEGDARARALQTQVDDYEALVTSLKAAVAAQADEAGQNAGVLQAKNDELALLEARARKGATELEDARRELGGQIDELRHAGQETIALYEERLGAAESKRYELEDVVEQLEEQLRRQRALGQGSAARASAGEDVSGDSAEAIRIDNEMLREQLVHLQRKLSGLEDMLEETRGNAEREETAMRARLQRHKDGEATLRTEAAETRAEIERLAASEMLARGKAEEAAEALRENTLALENARAEIEGLRAEVASLESLHARNSTEKARTEDCTRRIALERSRHDEEVAQLKELLEAARTARKDALQELVAVKSESVDASNSMASLKQMVETLDSDKADPEHVHAELIAKLEHEQSTIAELRHVLEERTLELEASRKTHNRDRPINVGLQELAPSPASSPLPTPTPTPSKHDVNTAREEIKGLKHIIQELRRENSTIVGKNKTLESENKMLMKETDSLREELQLLEENVEQSILREESALASESELSADGSGSPDAGRDARAQKKLLELKTKYDTETESLRKKMAELEKKSVRTIHDLNKEVNELESLVEAKDELEREIERLKQKVAKGTRAGKSSSDPPASAPASISALITNPGPMSSRHASSNSTSTINASDASASSSGGGARNGAESEEVCEICEQPGHDIFTCPLLKSGPDVLVDAHGSHAHSKSAPSESEAEFGAGPGSEADLFCEDCEGFGHLSASCPYSMDVF
ncbi:hypothetical protein M0805_003758 [Coniferiporia weirii]|nr:hypothetical protein M0805_003758 [Coniferiporia weirii]